MGNNSSYFDKQSSGANDNRGNSDTAGREYLYYSTTSKNLSDGFFVDGMYANRRKTYNSNTYGSVYMNKIGSGTPLYNGEDIWIVSHGYRDNSGGSFTEIANDIKNQFPSATVLTLNWSNIACGSALNSVDGIDLCRTANWIRPIAERIVEKLKRYGVTDPQKINLVGHSLGSLLSAEISRVWKEQSGNYVSRMTLLDPPSEAICGVYNVKNFPNSLGRIDRFANYAVYAISFVGNWSSAGNDNLNKTADYSYWMEFDQGFTDTGESHQWVVQTWRRMNSMNKINSCFDGCLSAKNIKNNMNTSFYISSIKWSSGQNGYGTWNSGRTWNNNNGVVEAGNPNNNNPKNVSEVQRVWTRDNNGYYLYN